MPRTQKKIRSQGQGQPFRGHTLEAKDRNARGQAPRTQAQVLSKKKKKVLHKNFLGDLQKKKKGLHKNILGDLQKKKGFHKNFSSDLHKKTFSKKFFNRSTNF